MTVEHFLNLLTQIIFLCIAGITLFNWVRQRDETHFDLALVFVSMAITIIAQDLQEIFPAQTPALMVIFFMGLISHPYFLLRVARYFQPTPRIVWRLAIAGLLLVFASFLLSKAIPILVFALAIAYFLILESYVTFLLIQGALTIPGITGRRLRLASIGSGLLVLVFLIALMLLRYEAMAV